MAQVNFSDKTTGGQLTANDVNSLKSAINDNEGLLSNGTVSGYYDSNNQWRYNHHLIPASNANFDLGSAEYKVRHLFLSDNSLWVGDELKIDASPEGTLQTKKRDKSKLPSYITSVLDGNEAAAHEFLNVSKTEEITLKDLEKYAQSIDPNVTLSDIFPAEGSSNYQDDDYESKTKVNQSKNQRKKIYIEYDNLTLAPSVPTLDLNENTDFEFYINNNTITSYESNFGEIPVKLIPTEHHLNKFNIYISKPSNNESANGSLFNSNMTYYVSFSNNDGSMSFKRVDSDPLIANQSTAIHFECSYVKSTSISIPESIYALGTDPNNFTYTYKMTVDGVDYYWLSNNQALEGSAITEQRSLNSDASDGNHSLYINIDSGNPIFFLASYNNESNITPSSEYTIESVQGSLTWNGNAILNANIVQNIFFGETNLLNGTLYTKYNYYGNPNQYSDDGRGAA